MKKKKIKTQEVSQEQEVKKVKKAKEVSNSSEKSKTKDKKNKEKAKKVVLSEEDKKEKELIQEVATKPQEVITKESKPREVKYLYPEDVVDSLAKKTWRQKTRSEIHRLELAVSRIKDTSSKEYKKALKECNAFKASVLKPKS